MTASARQSVNAPPSAVKTVAICAQIIVDRTAALVVVLGFSLLPFGTSSGDGVGTRILSAIFSAASFTSATRLAQPLPNTGHVPRPLRKTRRLLQSSEIIGLAGLFAMVRTSVSSGLPS